MSDTGKTEYDLAVIGGGIAGAAIAREGAIRGLSVILLEKNSFGSGTSSKSSKLIHGGIRYLEVAWAALLKGHFGEAFKNFVFVFHSLAQSRALARDLPDLIKPLPLIIPIYKNDKRGRLTVFLGTFFYYFLALFSGGGRLPSFFWSKSSLLKTVPELDGQDLLGGVKIWDHQTDDRALVQKTIEEAQKRGAHCLENSPVTHYRLLDKNNVYELEFLENGAPKIIYAGNIVNASGPWVDQIRRKNEKNAENLILPIAGSHIEFARFLPIAVILQARDGRVFFAINIGQRTRIGTTEWSCPDPENITVPESDIDYLLASLRRYFPSKNLKRSDIVSMDAGIRPLARSDSADGSSSISREHEIHKSSDGVLHILGVKLTDHRRAAKDVISRIL